MDAKEYAQVELDEALMAVAEADSTYARLKVVVQEAAQAADAAYQTQVKATVRLRKALAAYRCVVTGRCDKDAE